MTPRRDDVPMFIVIWRFLGAPIATLGLVSAYWCCTLLSDYVSTPTRHWYEVAFALPIMSLASFLVASIAQILAYVVVTACAVLFIRWTGHAPLWPLILVSPLLGLLTWYGYDHFVMDYRFFTEDLGPYQHGLTFRRFLYAWGFEILVVLGYWWPMRSRRTLLESAA